MITAGTNFASRSSLDSGVSCLISVLDTCAQLFVGHQEDRFDFGIKLTIRHHHCKLARDIG